MLTSSVQQKRVILTEMHVCMLVCESVGNEGESRNRSREPKLKTISICVNTADSEAFRQYLLVNYKLIIGEKLIIFFSDNK